MNITNIFLIVMLATSVDCCFGATAFKNKDVANSTLNDRQRAFMNTNIFSTKLNLAPWNQAFDDALAFVEDNSRAAGIVGSRDKVIMETVGILRSANRAIMSTISNAYNEYVLPKMRIEEARDYVRDNMIAARNVLLSIEKNSALANVRDEAILPGKKNAVQLMLSIALKLKVIANKALDDFKAIAPQLTKQDKVKNVANQLEDLWLEDAQDDMQQMERYLKSVPFDKSQRDRWLQEVTALNRRIAQTSSAAARIYEQRIIDACKKAGFTPVIKPSLQQLK